MTSKLVDILNDIKKPYGIKLTRMDKNDFNNWIGNDNIVGGKLTVYRGTDVDNAGLRYGDYCTTNREYAKTYGKNIQQFIISIKNLQYVRGHKNGDPTLTHSSFKPVPVELIYVGEDIPGNK